MYTYVKIEHVLNRRNLFSYRLIVKMPDRINPVCEWVSQAEAMDRNKTSKHGQESAESRKILQSRLLLHGVVHHCVERVCVNGCTMSHWTLLLWLEQALSFAGFCTRTDLVLVSCIMAGREHSYFYMNWFCFFFVIRQSTNTCSQTWSVREGWWSVDLVHCGD